MSRTRTAGDEIRVLHVTFDMGIGGTEQVIRQLIMSTHSLGVKSEIVCIDGEIGPLGLKMQEEAGIPVHVFERSPGFDFGMISKLRALIKANKYDVVHCHQYSPYLYGFLGAFLSGAKIVFTEHGRFHPDRYRRKAFLVNRLFAYMTSGLVAISSATRDALAKYEFMPRSHIEVIYNGIEDLVVEPADVAEVKARLGIPEGDLVMGTVSRLDPIKNQPMMLKAFKGVLQHQPNAWLLMVGDGPERAALESLAVALGISERVLFTGFIVQPKAYLAAMDIFLLTSFSEGTSMTLLESMSLGIPSVVTDVGGNPEIVEQGKTGHIVQVDDVEACVDAIVALASDRESGEGLYNKISVSARKRFLEHFSSSVMAERYLALYSSL